MMRTRLTLFTLLATVSRAGAAFREPAAVLGLTNPVSVAFAVPILDLEDRFRVWFSQESGTPGGAKDVLSGISRNQIPIAHRLEVYSADSK